MKMKTPVGELTLIGSDKGLSALLWEDDKPDRVRVKAEVEDKDHSVLKEAEAEIREYFLGTRKHFTIALNPIGTEFQLKVWNELKKIPYGETISYKELAIRVGNPKASRAVGGANGKNPLSIIVPCHRVIGASGKLTGFAGGVDVKSKLLNFEKDCL
ncbi:MAG: methylated-DNA-[protein]-cysteine S-methyltransferase [Bacteriovoracaceae bacterium]|jgi:methylated-DNA-[protein]-cysteine S-methyltransferase